MRTKILKKVLSLALTVIISGSVSAFNSDIINAVSSDGYKAPTPVVELQNRGGRLVKKNLRSSDEAEDSSDRAAVAGLPSKYSLIEQSLLGSFNNFLMCGIGLTRSKSVV